MIRWPWVKRSEHERITAELECLLGLAYAERNTRIEECNKKTAEIARLRAELLAEQNAHSVTRGRLVADAHARGEPAP